MYLVARRIQTAWRCASLRREYVRFVAARIIQTIWRGKSARTQYRNFIAARRIQTSLFESSEYSRHTPSSGRQGEFKPVGVARTPGLRLSHTSLRAASKQRGVTGMPTERTIHTLHPELSRQWCVVDTCDVFFAATRRIQTNWRGYTKRVPYKC
jgi:hypothetical protein